MYIYVQLGLVKIYQTFLVMQQHCITITHVHTQIPLIFLQKMDLLLKKTPQDEVKGHVLPMILASLETENRQVQVQRNQYMYMYMYITMHSCMCTTYNIHACMLYTSFCMHLHVLCTCILPANDFYAIYKYTVKQIHVANIQGSDC